jgi:hypothetical protein
MGAARIIDTRDFTVEHGILDAQVSPDPLRQGLACAVYSGDELVQSRDRRRFVSTRLAATLLADGASCFVICACPALVIKRDCS